MVLDLLAIAPHPDDAELWCGGYIAKAASQGYKVAILDLTEGELSSNGTVSSRAKEAKSASQLLGLSYRANLKIADGGISVADTRQVRILVKALRELKPSMVLAPYFIERHPDHEGAAKLIEKAVFNSGLKAYESKLGKPHSVSSLVYYQIRVGFKPSFLVDISEVYEIKRSAILSYKSQLGPQASVKTLLASPMTLRAIESRDAFYGAKLGVNYAEAYFTRSAIGLRDPIQALCLEEKPHFFD